MDLKFHKIEPKWWDAATSIAYAYLRDYSDKKIGFHAGVVYFIKDKGFYVYKTKTQLVVRSV